MSLSVSVLFLLKDKGFTVVDISRSLKVNRQQVYKAIKCLPNSSRRIRLYIASVIGRPPSLLFLALPLNVKILDDFEFMINLESEKRVLPL